MMNFEYSRSHAPSARLFWALALGLFAGCAAAGGSVARVLDDGDASVAETPQDLIAFEVPSLVRLAPSNLSLGDTVQIFGERFLAPEYGTTKLVLDGTYTDENGGQHLYQASLGSRFRIQVWPSSSSISCTLLPIRT